MNKIIGLLVAGSMVCGVQAMAFDEDRFRSTLESVNQISIPLAGSFEKGSGNAASGAKGGQTQANNDFVWLKAEKVNQQLELLIRGIESAKGVATALAIIVNLYESDKITVDVAATAVQILKLRAVFLKVFITNGDTELEIMINILNEHEADFASKVSNGTKTTVNIEAKGKITNPATAEVPSVR